MIVRPDQATRLRRVPRFLLAAVLAIGSMAHGAQDEPASGSSGLDFFQPDTLRYHTYGRTMRVIDSLVALHPDIARIETLGITATGHRAVVAVKISDNPGLREPEPAVLFNGAHHACECIGPEICLYLLDSLLANYGRPETRRWIDSLQIFVVPMVNPDGHEVNFLAGDTWWRKNTRDNNRNGFFDHDDGVDVNRNYPFGWSDADPDSTSREYRGPYPLSEVESQGLAYLTRRERFVVDVCYHSSQTESDWEEVYHPLTYAAKRVPDYSAVRQVGIAFARSIVNDSGTGHYTPVGAAIDGTGGEYRNWAYYNYGTFALTDEVGTGGYYPPPSRVDSLCQRNFQAVRYLLNRTLGSGVWGQVSDSLTDAPLPALVKLVPYDTNTTVYKPIMPRYADSLNGCFFRLTDTVGSYRFEVSCPGYVTKTVGPIAVAPGRATRIVVLLSVGNDAWARQADLPEGGKGKNVKDGGALAGGAPAGNDTGMVFAFKGNNRCEFYRYNTLTNTWIARESIPAYNRLGRKKAVRKGASLAFGTNGRVYATKGNNSLEFWEYSPGTGGLGSGVWAQKADVPPGAKTCKEGVSAVAVSEAGTSYIYLLKGSGTFEFYRYNADADAWDTSLPTAPAGTSGKPYKNGSCLAYDGGDTIYALKGSANEFFAYSISGRNWVNKDPLPLIGASGRKKKVKDGAGMACYRQTVYALKGGNTDEFWMFDCASRKWSEQTQLPAGAKRVKGGGALTFSDADKSLYAFRGNNSREYWKYGPIAADGSRLTAGSQPEEVQVSSLSVIRNPSLRVAPNPSSGTASISYSLPKSGVVSLKLYDVAGKLVKTLVSGRRSAGGHSIRISDLGLGASRLGSALYLLRYEAGEYRATEKLVIE
jgi:hypothetical protein